MTELTCFKSYDIRGKLGESLNTDIAYKIGRAFARVMDPGHVVVGRDARETSAELCAALTEGLRAEGVSVSDIGLCGTEEVYYATGAAKAGGGIMVTASHNPIDYNGMKLVGPSSTPIDPTTVFRAIHDMAASEMGAPEKDTGPYQIVDVRAEYSRYVCDFADSNALRPMKVLFNAGNGPAGLTADSIVQELSDRGVELAVERQFWEPDGSFPNGIPNPLLFENRAATADRVVATGADIGVAWDGDFDRCFFFDETGSFVDGEYVVALLARSFLDSEPNAHIVHDPRVIWATQDTVKTLGGHSDVAKVGHAFMKSVMRENKAVYGGEMSAHHYFRDFFYCDSGMIPWLKVIELMGRTGQSLSALVADLQERFPSSGEINFRVADPKVEIETLAERLGPSAVAIDRLDGVSLEFPDWRVNLRASNTEPLLRLNIETRGDRELLREKTAEIQSMISTVG